MGCSFGPTVARQMVRGGSQARTPMVDQPFVRPLHVHAPPVTEIRGGVGRVRRVQCTL